MPILAFKENGRAFKKCAQHLGAVVAPTSGQSWVGELSLWSLQNLSTNLAAAIAVITGSPNAGGTLSPQQKAALIAAATRDNIKAQGANPDPAAAAADANQIVTSALMSDNADPSQAGIATTFQAPVDTLLTGSPMPSGTVYDTLVAGLAPDPAPPSWLSQNWMLLAGLGVVGLIIYKIV